ncbi:unnamed protein product [Staurois parvus]|uniref:Uncharacterized protein n=1 Tax=Staurois parvus TaxID=386267 RepID=A0ABN9BDV1_9NEOB|nr:unnamed protein product [Staurois parvus]
MRHCKIYSYKHGSQRQRHDGTCSFATGVKPPVGHPWCRTRVSNWRPSSCCQTTSPMRHCTIDS